MLSYNEFKNASEVADTYSALKEAGKIQHNIIVDFGFKNIPFDEQEFKKFLNSKLGSMNGSVEFEKEVKNKEYDMYWRKYYYKQDKSDSPSDILSLLKKLRSEASKKYKVKFTDVFKGYIAK